MSYDWLCNTLLVMGEVYNCVDLSLVVLNFFISHLIFNVPKVTALTMLRYSDNYITTHTLKKATWVKKSDENDPTFVVDNELDDSNKFEQDKLQ